MADLLPCPFCTSKSIEVEIIQNDCAWVECPACLSRGPEEATPERAAEAWNARTEVITNEPQTAAVQTERDRCVAICEGWMERFEGTEIQYTSAREYACDAINDIMDLIRDGVDPWSSVTRPHGK